MDEIPGSIASVQNKAGLLLRIARDAHQRTMVASSATTSNQMDTLVAIVFSAMSVEAFMSDAVAHAEMLLSSPSPWPEPSTTSAFAEAVNEIERNRGSLKLKYLVSKVLLSGRPYDKGAQPYQDFSLLIDLRNALVHIDTKHVRANSSASLKENPPKAAKRLPGHLIDKDQSKSWVTQISTPAVAQWACNATISMIKSFVEDIPESDLRNYLGMTTDFDPMFQLIT